MAVVVDYVVAVVREGLENAEIIRRVNLVGCMYDIPLHEGLVHMEVTK